MKSYVYHTYGSPEVLKQATQTPPPLQPGELRIQVTAASLNPVDSKIRRGDLRLLTGWKFPKVPGTDFAGTILESRSETFQPGQVVFGLMNPIKGGTFAEEIVVKSNQCAPCPAHLNVEQAGVLPVVGLTVLEALVLHGQLRKGQSVFIHGCTGGVGSVAVQLAKALGARITGTCSAKNLDFAAELGVAAPLDYNQLDYNSHRAQYDLVFDTSGTMPAGMMRSLGRSGARYATTGFSLGMLLHSLFSRAIKLIIVKPESELLNHLRQLLETHHIEPVITQTWSFDQLVEATRQFETTGGKGKVLIRVGRPATP